jgi:cyanophycin synthetase
MEIRSILSLEGANVFSSKPVIKMFLHLGARTEVYTNELYDFVDKLVNNIPTLHEHFCSRGRPGGFVERLKEGTLLGHVVEHTALELMSLSGHTVRYGKTLGTEEPGLYEIVVEYESKEGAIQAVRSAVTIVTNLLEGMPVDVGAEIEAIKEISAKTELGPSTKAIVHECKERGIPIIRLDRGSLLQLGYGKYQKRIEATITQKTASIGVDIACDKTLTKELLGTMGISVPKGEIATSEEAALRIAKTIGVPVVIKPDNGNHGKGVALELHSDAEIRSAFNVAQGYSENVIVERYITGKQYRIAVVGQKVVAVAERVPAQVIGDGVKTIRQLIEEANNDPLRGEDHEKPLTKIRVDPIVLLGLTKKGLSLDSIPNKGQTLYLRESANISTGGTAIDVTEQVHESFINLAIRAVKIVGLDVAGIDLVTPDISQPYHPSSSAIIEINAAPGIRMHHFPSAGKPRNVAKEIIDNLFPFGLPYRVPIVSVTGTNGKTTTTRMISHILRHKELMVGMANSDGIWIGREQIVAGDTTGPASARMVLRDPDVEVAVLETARGGILRAGLGYDYADVAVVTNISEDHFGQYGVENLEDLAHAKSVVAEAVKRHSYVVLNADNQHVAKMATHTKGRVIYFSTLTDNPLIKQHLDAGGRAIFIKRGKIIVSDGDQTIKLGNIKDFPATFEGKALHNVQNALAAIGAAWGLGIATEVIREGLITFSCGLDDNPGRLNLYELNGFKLMIDYGHNAAGIEEIINFAKKLNPKHLIGVITVPGDRPDESIFKVGAIAGKGFDYLFIREDEDLRGRNPGEIATILRKGALSAGLKDTNIRTVLSEVPAFESAVNLASPNDLVVAFYERLEPLIHKVNEYLAKSEGASFKQQAIDEMIL